MQRLRLKSDKPSRLVEDDVVPCALYACLTPFFIEERMLMVGQSKLMPGQLPGSGYAYDGKAAVKANYTPFKQQIY